MGPHPEPSLPERGAAAAGLVAGLVSALFLAGCPDPGERPATPPGKEKQAQQPTETGDAPRSPTPGALVPRRPAPPYDRLDGVTFEPSACAWDAPTERLLVLNDKDAIVYRYALEKGQLKLVRGEHHRALLLPDGGFIAKLEALAPLEDGRYLAASAFDRKDAAFQRLVRFRFAKTGTLTAEPVGLDVAAVEDRLRACEPKLKYWKVEGIGTTPGDGALLLAIRSIGTDYAHKIDVAWVMRCPRIPAAPDRLAFGAPDRLVRFDVKGAAGREEGASGITRDRTGGGYLLLSSYEDEARERDIEAHGGHLFRIPTETIEGPGPLGTDADPPVKLGAPLATFRAKSEGVAVTAERLFIVFDDDTTWKTNFEGYEQSQGRVLILERAQLGK